LIFGSKHQCCFQLWLFSSIPHPRSGAPRTHSARPVGARLLLLLQLTVRIPNTRRDRQSVVSRTDTRAHPIIGPFLLIGGALSHLGSNRD
jgi:hypothetical protein